MKKIFSLLLALSLLLSGFAALAEGAYPVTEEPITVKALGTDSDPAAFAKREMKTWKLLAEITNVNFEFTAIDPEQLPVFLAAGNWPDVFCVPLTAAQLNDYGILGNRFVNYLDYLEYMPNLKKTMEEYPMVKNVMVKSNGAMYELPRVDNVATACTARLHFRQDVLDQYGLSMPETVDEFYSVLKTIYEKTGKSPLGDMSDYEMQMLFPSFGPYVHFDFDDDGQGKLVHTRTSEQYRRFLSFIHKLYAENLLHQEYLTMDGATRSALVKNGDICFGTSYFSNLTADCFADGQIHLGTLAPLKSQWNDAPRVYNGEAFPQPIGWAINAKSEHIVEICKALDVAYATAEVVPGTGLYSAAFWYGPENVTWAWMDDAHTEYDYINIPSDMAPLEYARKVYISWTVGRNDVWGNAVSASLNNSHYRQLGYIANVKPYTAETLVPFKLLNFTEDEQTVLDDYYVNITTYISEMQSKFVAGVENIDDDAAWEAYCKTVADMHMAEVLEVYQASYDRWLGK